MEVIFLGLTILCAVFILVVYHKIFNVYYFNVANGCLKEIIGATIGGIVLATLIINFWYITLPISIIIAIIAFKPKK